MVTVFESAKGRAQESAKSRLSALNRSYVHAQSVKDIIANVAAQSPGAAVAHVIADDVYPEPRFDPGGRFAGRGRLTPERRLAARARAWPTDVPLTIFGDGPNAQVIERLHPDDIELSGIAPRVLLPGTRPPCLRPWEPGACTVVVATPQSRPAVGKATEPNATNVTDGSFVVVPPDWTDVASRQGSL